MSRSDFYLLLSAVWLAPRVSPGIAACIGAVFAVSYLLTMVRGK